MLVCQNRRAAHRYHLEGRIEAGLVLAGSEVKSLRERRADIEGAYAGLQGDGLYLHGMHIGPYAQATVFKHEAKASRKLLVHRRELEKLRGQLTQRGYTLVPLRLYFKGGWAKVELALAKHKDQRDRRQEIRAQAAEREAKAAMARARKG